MLPCAEEAYCEALLEDAGAGFKGRPTKTVLCGQRRHTPCRGKEAKAVPAESIRPDRSRTTETGTRIRKSTCSYVAVYRFCAKNNNLNHSPTFKKRACFISVRLFYRVQNLPIRLLLNSLLASISPTGPATQLRTRHGVFRAHPSQRLLFAFHSL